MRESEHHSNLPCSVSPVDLSTIMAESEELEIYSLVKADCLPLCLAGTVVRTSNSIKRRIRYMVMTIH